MSDSRGWHREWNAAHNLKTAPISAVEEKATPVNPCLLRKCQMNQYASVSELNLTITKINTKFVNKIQLSRQCSEARQWAVCGDVVVLDSHTDQQQFDHPMFFTACVTMHLCYTQPLDLRGHISYIMVCS